MCVIKLLTSYYTYYIQLKLRYFFIFSNTKKDKINYKKQAKKLLLLQAKANTKQLQLKLELLKKKRYSYKRNKIATTKKLKQLEDIAKILKNILLLKLVAYIANFNSLNLDSFTNLSQLQAKFFLIANFFKRFITTFTFKF